MKFALPLVIGLILAAVSCRPAAAPVVVGDKPVSINDVPLKDSQGRVMKPIHEMSWTGMDGTIQKLKDYRGKAIVLDFWATYCPPCIEEIPHLKALKARYGDDLVLVGMHVGGDEDKPKIPEFVDRLKIDYPLAYPEDALTSFIFGNDSAIPQTAIFDRDGKLVEKITGFSEPIRKELDQAVEKAVNGG